MGNKQLIKKEDVSVFDKIRGFFSKVFKKEKKASTCVSEQINVADKNNEFKDEIKICKVDCNAKEINFKEYTKSIESNPNLIENLSNEGLDKLISYYEKITGEKSAKIARLKASA